MNNKIGNKGFTLIELLSVIIILGVIMTIAVPNVLSMLDRNKKDTFIEHAKTMVNQAEYTLRKDDSIDYPGNNGEAIVLTLEYLNTDDVSNSPYGTKYNLDKSFVVIVNKTNDGITEYNYYVQLVACSDDNCSNNKDNNRGIKLTSFTSLSGGNRFSLVSQGTIANVSIDLETNNADGTISYSKIESEIGSGTTITKVYTNS